MSQRTSQEDISWGATGVQPADGFQFTDDDENNAGEEEPTAGTFNWLVTTFIALKNDVAADISDILDGTLQVGDAASADDATNVTATYKGNDIDNDGDGTVNAADVADEAKRMEQRTSYPSNPSAGRMVWRTDK